MSNATHLKQLGLSEGLIDHLCNFDPTSRIGFRCQPPFYCFLSPLIKQSIVPLWECGTIFVYFNNKFSRFEKCSLEDINNIWSHYSSLQGVLAELFIDLYEDELTDHELRVAANQVGFLHLERLLIEAQELQKNHYDLWRKSFPKSCE